MSSIAYKCLLVHWDSLYNMDCPTGTQGFLPNTDITSYTLHEMYQYTFCYVCSIHVYCWNTGTEMGCTNIHTCYCCLSHLWGVYILLGHWDRYGMYQLTHIHSCYSKNLLTHGHLLQPHPKWCSSA